MTIATPFPPAALKAPATPDGTLLDAVLPRYDYGSSVAAVIHASPSEIFQALRTVTLAEMPLAHALGTMRYLPGLLSGRLRRPPDEASRPFFEVAGSRLLAEAPEREMVFGCAGILHDLVDQQFVGFEDVEAFQAFERPGYEKLAQSFRIAGGDDSSGYTVVAEHRTRVLGTHARWKFALYWWLMVGWAGDLLLRMLLDAVKRRAERAGRGDALLRASWRRPAIVAIKLIHSLIFLLNSAAIVHIFVVGIRNRPSRWTRPALAVSLAEVAVFVANRRRCPLTDLVEHLGSENGRVSDIFLPRWLADRIPQLCGPPLLVGVLALAWRRWVADRSAGSG
jgi:hypothetical protein